jgi:hypothetical protein
VFSALPPKADFPILKLLLPPANSFANAAIAASRDGSKPCAAADVAYLSGLISFDNLRSG